jgi:hypothetical protein
MKRLILHPAWALLVLLATLALGTFGCASVESENASARPWNSPRGWETGGLPSTLNEGR